MIEHHEENFFANAPICHDCDNFDRGVCKLDSVLTNDHANAAYCPLNLFPQSIQKPAGWDEIERVDPNTQPQPRTVPITIKKFDGAPIWNEIHRRPLRDDLSGEAAWLGELVESLPCGDCRRDARVYLSNEPPDLSSSLAYARWGWTWHNAVNTKLGKPRPAYSACAAEHGWPK